MEKQLIETLKAELEGLETGLEVLVSNVATRGLTPRSRDLIDRMEKRIENMKQILAKLSE